MFLDYERSFEVISQNLLCQYEIKAGWPIAVQTDRIVVERSANGEPIVTFNQDFPIPAGITCVNLEGINFFTETKPFLAIVTQLINYFINQLAIPSASRRILVIQRFWIELIMMGSYEMNRTLLSLLQTARKRNAEVWLLSDGDFYSIDEDSEVVEWLQSLFANTMNTYLFDHSALSRQFERIKQIHHLSDKEMDLLESVNRNQDTWVMPCQDVFLKRGGKPGRVYSVVTSKEEYRLFS